MGISGMKIKNCKTIPADTCNHLLSEFYGNTSSPGILCTALFSQNLPSGTITRETIIRIIFVKYPPLTSLTVAASGREIKQSDSRSRNSPRHHQRKNTDNSMTHFTQAVCVCFVCDCQLYTKSTVTLVLYLNTGVHGALGSMWVQSPSQQKICQSLLVPLPSTFHLLPASSERAFQEPVTFDPISFQSHQNIFRIKIVMCWYIFVSFTAV